MLHIIDYLVLLVLLLGLLIAIFSLVKKGNACSDCRKCVKEKYLKNNKKIG